MTMSSEELEATAARIEAMTARLATLTAARRAARGVRHLRVVDENEMVPIGTGHEDESWEATMERTNAILDRIEAKQNATNWSHLARGSLRLVD